MSSVTSLLWKTFRGIVITIPGCPAQLITISPEQVITIISEP